MARRPVPWASSPRPRVASASSCCAVGRRRAAGRGARAAAPATSSAASCTAVKQRQDRGGRVAGGEGVDGELEERGAGDAVAVGSAVVDDADGEEVVEPVGDELREEAGELVEGGGGAGFVEVDELVGGEAEDVGELVAVVPAGEEVADPGERVAASCSRPISCSRCRCASPVDADAAAALGGGEQPHGLVLADRAGRQPGAGGELIDGQLLDRRRRGSVRPRLDSTVDNRYGKHRDC